MTHSCGRRAQFNAELRSVAASQGDAKPSASLDLTGVHETVEEVDAKIALRDRDRDSPDTVADTATMYRLIDADTGEVGATGQQVMRAEIARVTGIQIGDSGNSYAAAARALDVSGDGMVDRAERQPAVVAVRLGMFSNLLQETGSNTDEAARELEAAYSGTGDGQVNALGRELARNYSDTASDIAGHQMSSWGEVASTLKDATTCTQPEAHSNSAE